jgi:2-dehydro-3-deoxygluconokinase
MQPDIVALGEPLIEFSAAASGSLVDGAQFVAGCGGDTCNFVVAVSRLGGRAGYISRIGDDPFAQLLRRRWEEEGVDATHVGTDPSARTGIYFITRKDDAHTFTYYRQDSAASRITPDDLPEDYIRQAGWLHVSGISQAISETAAATVDRAIALAREAQATVSYDPNLRLKLWPLSKARETIHRTVPRIDILLPSYEDACRLTGLQAPEDIVRTYLAMGPAIVVLKMGAEGALLGMQTPETGAPGLTRVAACPVESIDASGAGDTFDAAFTVSRLSGRPPVECVRFANAAGALVTTGIGAIAPIPNYGAVQTLMDRQGSATLPTITGDAARHEA